MTEPSRPNVVWINADHYAYAHHFARNRGLIRTPAFDRLCAEGVRFTNAYTVCPLCTPARASLVTGQFPHRHGILNNDGERLRSREAFLPDAPIYARALRAAGVRPAFFGKWHAVGGGPGTAQDHGFEGWTAPGYGHPYGTETYREYLRELGLPEEPTVDVEWHLRDASKRGRVRLEDTGGQVAGVSYHPAAGVIDGPKEVHEAYFVTHLANRYLEERARDGEPFCLRVDPWGPHQPYFVAAPFAGTVDPRAIPEYPSFSQELADRPAHHREFLDLFRNNVLTRTWEEWQPVLARAYEHIALVDDAIGTVLATLDRLGLTENTVVIHSADHGDIIGAHGGLFDKGWLLVEETVRIPVAIRWAGVGASGAISDALISNLDFVATVRDLAGAPPADAPQDGVSLTPLVRAPNTADWADDLMIQSHGHYGKWYFQRALRFRHAGADWKYVANLDDRDELYDLSADPYELTNRLDDPTAADALADARCRLAARMERHEDNAPDALRLLARLRG